MSARHRWSYPVECVPCQSAGIVHVSQSSAPPFRTDAARDYVISDGFKLRPGDGVEPLIECAKCGVESAMGPQAI